MKTIIYRILYYKQKIGDMYMDIEYETKHVFFHVRNVSIYIIYGDMV